MILIDGVVIVFYEWHESFILCYVFFFFKQKTAYEMRISDWSSDVCSSDLAILGNGIFLAEGDEWLSQRRSAARSFQGCQLRRMTAAMQEAVGDLQQRWTDRKSTRLNSSH